MSLGRPRITVDAWDPGYGSSLDPDPDPDLDVGRSTARVDMTVERPVRDWAAVPPGRGGGTAPGAVLFVDGVRRLDARVWIETDRDELGPDGDEPGHDDRSAGADVAAGWCVSYAAGVVCCCATGSHLLHAEPRRSLFTTSCAVSALATAAGSYDTVVSPAGDGTRPVPQVLTAAVQRHLGDLEVSMASAARDMADAHGIDAGDDLLVVDGPLQGRGSLPRALGFVKTHRAEYLPAAQRPLVETLRAGERTPVFGVGTHWHRFTWYVRLPCPPGAPWAGIARVECSADLSPADAVELADLSQRVLPPFASIEYKDARAPQNLYPIGGLERDLRRRLGDHRHLYRAIRRAAA